MLPRSIRFQQTVEAAALYFSEEAAAEKAVGSGVPKTRMRNAGHVSAEIYNSLLQTYAKAGKMPPPVAKHMKIILEDKTSGDDIELKSSKGIDFVLVQTCRILADLPSPTIRGSSSSVIICSLII
ncbi:hypothetical protein GH714_024788 [Hevea brasiliensis]|uniref:Uncharacterized protein n=1 Tax=Hevea brasiliensis TaxID=3981 RepID=A0A6A6NIZ7_HEVBR|nr:hypothetical protein GH714_024788 [Hevea brasiliensis]